MKKKLQKCVIQDGERRQEIELFDPYVGQKVGVKEPDNSGTWEVVDIVKTKNKEVQKMDYQSYQEFVRSLAAPRSMVDFHAELETFALGLVGETGETADHVKKILFHELDFTDDVRDKMLLECGDILWYVTFGAVALGGNLDELLQGDIDLPYADRFNQDLRKYTLNMASIAGSIADTVNEIVDGKFTHEFMDGQEREDVKLLILYRLGKLVRDLITFIAVLGSNLQEVMDMNIAKLSRRYKSGAFSKEEFMKKQEAGEDGHVVQ